MEPALLPTKPPTRTLPLVNRLTSRLLMEQVPAMTPEPLLKPAKEPTKALALLMLTSMEGFSAEQRVMDLLL